MSSSLEKFFEQEEKRNKKRSEAQLRRLSFEKGIMAFSLCVELTTQIYALESQVPSFRERVKELEALRHSQKEANHDDGKRDASWLSSLRKRFGAKAVLLLFQELTKENYELPKDKNGVLNLMGVCVQLEACACYFIDLVNFKKPLPLINARISRASIELIRVGTMAIVRIPERGRSLDRGKASSAERLKRAEEEWGNDLRQRLPEYLKDEGLRDKRDKFMLYKAANKFSMDLIRKGCRVAPDRQTIVRRIRPLLQEMEIPIKGKK